MPPLDAYKIALDRLISAREKGDPFMLINGTFHTNYEGEKKLAVTYCVEGSFNQLLVEADKLHARATRGIRITKTKP